MLTDIEEDEDEINYDLLIDLYYALKDYCDGELINVLDICSSTNFFKFIFESI